MGGNCWGKEKDKNNQVVKEIAPCGNGFLIDIDKVGKVYT